MKKKALRQSAIREIYQSKARFFSILLIILLGVCFYAGIKATGPDMLHTADTYYKKQGLMDTKIVSTLGLDKRDVQLVEKTKGVSNSRPAYSLDVTEMNQNQVVRLMSYDMNAQGKMNQPVIVEGRLPETSGEVVLDSRVLDMKNYQIGDTLHLDKEHQKQMSQDSFTVVGFVKSPLFIDQVSRGNTTVGKGAVDFFALVPTEDFDLEAYTEIYVQYSDTEKEASYSQGYEKAYEKNVSILESSLAERPQERLEEIKAKGMKKVKDGQTDLQEGKQSLREGQDTLANAMAELENKKQQLANAETAGLPVEPDVKELLLANEAKLNEQQEKATKEQEKLDKAEKELTDKEQEINELTAPEYLFFSRNDSPAYSEFEDNADRISSIATVFPVFFFLIAALISLTTMTRMVDEKRGEIGTLKALGYTNWEISQKYIIYATSASLIGSLLGLVIGFNVFPTVIFNAYGSLYNLPPVIITYDTSYSIQSVIVALLCTLLASLIVLRVDLLSTPAILMRPKAPKPGKRILLERWTGVWRHLNFNQKVTARNLFRYKQRMLMTILGIAGCMAMIITGFGLKDSIGDIVELQFSKIWAYDATVTFNPEATEQETTDYVSKRDDITELNGTLELSQENATVVKKGFANREVTIDTPKDVSALKEFVLFNNRDTGEVYTLDDDGVIINEKLARLFEVSAGDEMTLQIGDHKDYTVKVSQVVENYVMHFVYMTPTYYEKTFHKQPNYYVELLKFSDTLSESKENEIAEGLMGTNKALNVSYTRQIGKAMDDTMSSLNIVVWVLIVSAALLAFIVLYNLTNINVSERIRELSTIKVLGFYDKEVTMYVYRENNVLTVLGMLLGCVLGILLHGFVLQTAEVDMMMFPKTIHPLSFLYSMALTVLFSSIVMLVMHRKLRKVDMIEALKSTE